MKMKSSSTRGFSLIELLVTVIILSVLAAIAIPSYWQYVTRGRRTDATRALQDVASREESYFFSNSAYTSSPTALGISSPTMYSPFYTVSVVSASTTAYVAQAVPISTQAKDTACATLSINQAGSQMTTGTATPATCWGSQ
ncbi:type IV pilin protein [Dyella sp. C9]|uniref:type IV pilin protein n=1 Tax=Dyella sp. C9 TaxID=2202154 RepID=UPI000DEF9CAB|nr:type IV pilin protein [Dyella sp. C9]